VTQELWTHERLKVKPWDGHKGHPQYKQTKYNGHRFTVYKQKNGTLVGFEREIRPDLEMTIKRPRIVEYSWWKALREIPPMSSVDGELCMPGGNAGDAAHAIAECLPELRFVPFAVPWWDGESIDSASVIYVMDVMQETTGLEYAETRRFLPGIDTLDHLLDFARVEKIEGFVLKEWNYSGWWKVKPQKTVDCVVTDFKDGNGKYLGMIGALVVSAVIDGVMTELASVSGMDDATREMIDEKNDLGRVVEVEYQDVGNKGRLIHAHFVRWRDDKPASECVYSRGDL